MVGQTTQSISKSLPLSARVKKGLEVIKESRLHQRPVWGEGLTVLDDETVKLPSFLRCLLTSKNMSCW
jgi:hypothetical protein